MKKVTAAEFVDLVKSDKDLYDRFKAALQKAEGRTASEVAGDLGYQIEMPEKEALDDDSLMSVSGGVRNNDDSRKIVKLDEVDPSGLFPISFGDDFNVFW